MSSALARLSRGLPPGLVLKIIASKSILIIEDAGKLPDFIEDLYQGAITHPYKSEIQLNMHTDLMQLIPLHVLNLHGNSNVLYTAVPSAGSASYTTHFIAKAVLDITCGDSHTFYRLYIIDDFNPLLIIELYATTDWIRYYRLKDMSRWVQYDREPLAKTTNQHFT